MMSRCKVIGPKSSETGKIDKGGACYFKLIAFYSAALYLVVIARLRHAPLKISTITTSSTMLLNSHGIEFFQRQIRKKCGMFGKNCLWK